jgi:hypothetical protein
VKLGARQYGTDEREATALGSMAYGTAGDSKLAMPVKTLRRSPLVVEAAWKAFADGTQIMGVSIDPDYSGVVAFPSVASTAPFVTLVFGLFPAVTSGSYTVDWHIAFTRTEGTQDADGLLQAGDATEFYDLGPEGTWEGSATFTATEGQTVSLSLYADADETDPYDSSWIIDAASWMRIR